MSNANRPISVYAICDSQGDVRYIGQCFDVACRVRNHLWASTKIGTWLRQEVREGRIPSVRVLLKIEPMCSVDEYTYRYAAMAVERFMIENYHDRQPGELINRQFKPSTQKPASAHKYRNVPTGTIVKMRFAAIVRNYDRQRKLKAETA